MRQKILRCKVAFMFFLGLLVGSILGTLILGKGKRGTVLSNRDCSKYIIKYNFCLFL